MSQKAFGGALVLAFGLSGALAAQGTATSQSPTQQQPSNPSMTAQTVTVEGCLVREKDVPGRQPNVAERAGVMEDFILTNAKFLKGSPHASGAATTGTAGATGTSGEHATAGTSGMAVSMFEVRGLAGTELEPHVGHRVEIEGRLNPADIKERKAEVANPSGEKSGDLPELHGVVIKKSSSTEPCTVK